jgi:hypothetical protein
VRDRAEGARGLGFARARITHLLDLTLLAPDLQLRVLDLEAVDGVEPISGRVLRRRGARGEGVPQVVRSHAKLTTVKPIESKLCL